MPRLNVLKHMHGNATTHRPSPNLYPSPYCTLQLYPTEHQKVTYGTETEKKCSQISLCSMTLAGFTLATDVASKDTSREVVNKQQQSNVMFTCFVSTKVMTERQRCFLLSGTGPQLQNTGWTYPERKDCRITSHST